MRSLIALGLMLMALITNAKMYSFENEIGAVLVDGEMSFLDSREQVVWFDIKIDGLYMIALLEDELVGLDIDEQQELTQRRADSICRWTGFSSAASFSTKGDHQVFKYENYWYLLDDNAGNLPDRKDLLSIEINPNARYLATSLVNSMLKLSGARDVVIRENSPLSFTHLGCVR